MTMTMTKGKFKFPIPIHPFLILFIIIILSFISCNFILPISSFTPSTSSSSSRVVFVDPVSVHCGGEVSIEITKFVACEKNPNHKDKGKHKNNSPSPSPSIPIECLRGSSVYPLSGSLSFPLPSGISSNTTIHIDGGGDEYIDENGNTKVFDSKVKILYKNKKQKKKSENPSESETLASQHITLTSPQVEWSLNPENSVLTINIPITLRESLLGFHYSILPFGVCDDTVVHVRSDGVTPPDSLFTVKDGGLLCTKSQKRKFSSLSENSNSLPLNVQMDLDESFHSQWVNTKNYDQYYFSKILYYLSTLNPFSDDSNDLVRCDLQLKFLVEFPNFLPSHHKENIKTVLGGISNDKFHHDEL